VVLTIPVPEQQKNAHDKHTEAVSQLPRRSRSQQFAHHQAQVEGSHMDQLPLQDILVSTQMRAPHAAGLVAMREAALDLLAALPE